MTIDKPNAFAFKTFINNEYQLCVCPRINDQWSESDIFYVSDGMLELKNELDDIKFHVIFVLYEPNDSVNTCVIKPMLPNSTFIRSNTLIASELYKQDQFFKVVEHGYQKLYGTDKTSGQRIETETNQ